jgi:hypothetical protein
MREEKEKEIIDNLKENRGYWELKGKALNHTLWRTCFENDMDLSYERLRIERMSE